METTALKKETTELQQKLGVMTFENNSLKDQLSKLELQHLDQTKELNHALTKLVRKSQDADNSQKLLRELQQKHEVQCKTSIGSQEAVSSQQILQLQAELKEIRDQNQVLAYEKWVLGQEKAQLYGQLKQIGSLA